MDIQEHFEDKGYVLMWLWPITIPLCLILILGLGLVALYLWFGGFLYDKLEALMIKLDTRQ